MNIEKLRKLQTFLMAEPRRFNMDMWSAGERTIEFQKPPCGTVACMAGLTCLMEGLKLSPDSILIVLENPPCCLSIPDQARRILGLTLSESTRLFHANHWRRPEAYAAYERAASSNDYPAMVRLACEEIDMLIEEPLDLDATPDNVPCAGEVSE